MALDKSVFVNIFEFGETERSRHTSKNENVAANGYVAANRYVAANIYTYTYYTNI